MLCINAVVIVVLIVFFIIESRKTAVLELNVAPLDSQITVNGDTNYNNGKYRLFPGIYEVVVSYPGLDAKTFTVDLAHQDVASVVTFLSDGDDFYYYRVRDNYNDFVALSKIATSGHNQTTDQDLNFLSAIVDIPDIEQSYWFYSEYSSENGNKYIDYSKSYRMFCLDNTQENVYPDFSCKDDFGFEGKHEIVSTLIGYFNFNYFSLSLPSKKGVTEVRIKPTNYNLNDVTKESYIQEAKNAVESLGVSPDLFTYYVMGPEDITIRYL